MTTTHNPTQISWREHDDRDGYQDRLATDSPPTPVLTGSHRLPAARLRPGRRASE
jgi:hypothetical protein